MNKLTKKQAQEIANKVFGRSSSGHEVKIVDFMEAIGFIEFEKEELSLLEELQNIGLGMKSGTDCLNVESAKTLIWWLEQKGYRIVKLNTWVSLKLDQLGTIIAVQGEIKDIKQ